jgi:hypothetical protein
MIQPKKTRRGLRGAIIGMALGDGSLYRNLLRNGQPCGHYKLSIAHSLRQKEYLLHKRSVVSDMFDYNISITETTHSAGNGKRYPVCRFQTRVHPRLTFIANRLIVDGKKRITAWALENITDEGLAYWWMDDGCLYLDKRQDHGGGSIIWGTYGYPREDIERLAAFLRERFNVDLRLAQHVKGGWYLKRGISEGRKLLDVLRNYAVPNMAYKFQYTHTLSRGPYVLSQCDATAPAPANIG